MGANSSKGRVEIDIKRQAWVRTRPNPAHPKHQGLNRAQSAAGARPQTTRRQQYYDVPPNYYQQEPERPIRRRGDEGRSRHDERGLRRAQSTRSESRSRQSFFEDDSDDEAGVPLHGRRHEGPAHYNSRGFSGGQYGSRGISHAQSNHGHGGPGQQGYDFVPPADHVRAQYAASRSQRGSQHDSQHGIRHGSHRGSEHDSQYGIRHGSHRGSEHDSQHGSRHGSHRDSQRRS